MRFRSCLPLGALLGRSPVPKLPRRETSRVGLKTWQKAKTKNERQKHESGKRCVAESGNITCVTQETRCAHASAPWPRRVAGQGSVLLLCRLHSQTCSRQCATLWLGCATCKHCCMLARPRRDTCKTGCHAHALRSRHRESLSANAHEPQTGARNQHAREAPSGCLPFALLQRIIGCGRSRLTGRQGRRPGLLDPEANTPWGAEHDPRCLKRRALDVPTLCPGSPQGARVRILEQAPQIPSRLTIKPPRRQPVQPPFPKDKGQRQEASAQAHAR